MVTGYRRPLEEKDLWSLNSADRSHKVVPELVGRWNVECQKVKRSGTASKKNTGIVTPVRSQSTYYE